jgi:hypothetical protein
MTTHITETCSCGSVFDGEMYDHERLPGLFSVTPNAYLIWRGEHAACRPGPLAELVDTSGPTSEDGVKTIGDVLAKDDAVAWVESELMAVTPVDWSITARRIVRELAARMPTPATPDEDAVEWVRKFLHDTPPRFPRRMAERIVTELAARTSPAMPDRETLMLALHTDCHCTLESDSPQEKAACVEDAHGTDADAVMALLAEHGWRRPLNRDEIWEVLQTEVAVIGPHLRSAIADALVEAQKGRQ